MLALLFLTPPPFTTYGVEPPLQHMSYYDISLSDIFDVFQRSGISAVLCVNLRIKSSKGWKKCFQWLEHLRIKPSPIRIKSGDTADQ